jgi:hypothetical protein
MALNKPPQPSPFNPPLATSTLIGQGILDAQGRGSGPSGSPGLLMNIESILVGVGSTVWTKRTYDRPVVLVGISVESNGIGNVKNGPGASLYFAPYIRPKILEESRRASRRYIAHLDHAGDWWLAFGTGLEPVSPGRLTYAVIDATNPITAAAYLSLFGANNIVHSKVAITGPVGTFQAGPVQNFHRVALSIRNANRQPADATLANILVMYRLDGTTAPIPAEIGDSNTDTGHPLALGQTDVLVGDTLSLASIFFKPVMPVAVALPAILAGNVVFFTEWSL